MEEQEEYRTDDEEEDNRPDGFARHFLAVIAQYGHEALAGWLEKDQAPAEIRGMAEGLSVIGKVLEEEGEYIGTSKMDMIGDAVGSISRGLHFCDWKFHAASREATL